MNIGSILNDGESSSRQKSTKRQSQQSQGPQGPHGFQPTHNSKGNENKLTTAKVSSSSAGTSPRLARPIAPLPAPMSSSSSPTSSALPSSYIQKRHSTPSIPVSGDKYHFKRPTTTTTRPHSPPYYGSEGPSLPAKNFSGYVYQNQQHQPPAPPHHPPLHIPQHSHVPLAPQQQQRPPRMTPYFVQGPPTPQHNDSYPPVYPVKFETPMIPQSSSASSDVQEEEPKKSKRSKAPNSNWTLEDDRQLVDLVLSSLPKQDYAEYARILGKRDSQTVRYRWKVLVRRAKGEGPQSNE